MPYSAVDFTPPLGVSRSLKWYFFFLVSGLLLAVPAIAAIPMIRCIDLSNFLLLLL
jgi:hypothetical protein